MNRKDSKRKSRQDLQHQTLSSNGVFITAKGRPRQSRRRMTCPSPAEINKAMVAVTLAPLGKGCSLEELLEKCVQSFDLEGQLWRNEDTVHMTLVMHSWVVPSAEFAQKLLQIYPSRSTYKDAAQNHTRIAVCHLARFWISQYPEMFRLDAQLEQTMAEFWEVVEEGRGRCPGAIPSSLVLEPDASKPLQESPSFNKKRKVSLLFDHLEPSELANHLSFLDFKCLCRITHLDYRSYTMQTPLQEIPRLARSVALCNSISQWVQIMILNRPTPQQRAEVFTKFIQVTQKLRKLQNFNTLMAVIGGLCHSAISRLKETHGFLSQDVLKTLSEMTELLSSGSNYSTYRRVYHECAGFKVPVLGVHLKDLVSLNEALPDYLTDGKINVSKLHGLYQHLLELRQLQSARPPTKADKDVTLLLTSSLDLFHTEDEIYALSYSREPRSHKPQPTVPFKTSTDIAHWTPETPGPQDAETLSHNVEQMVETVFQFYDPKRRGFISVEDFDKIVANLPFSCHILEKEHEGPVSRQAMASYFMKASHVCSKLGVTFLRSLLEARLRKSPLCGSCIWAVAKQGLDADGMQSWSRAGESRTPQSRTFQKSTQTDGGSEDETPGSGSAAGPPGEAPRCGDACGSSHALYGQVREMEKEKNRLLLENAGLHCTNSQLSAENARLQSQLCALQDQMRMLSLDAAAQPAIGRILDTINSLHL
ncbi:RAS guanyl-releasing protein 4 [Spea bombifrons]|uniref:RAS guanyl-releasing protein 4 n=1 Tax=Spea bombifrons TaxID=233779 RepID=UPI00234B2FEB|nr:RAS guanyl-releasing protein 4 [Spea bombifrons]